jgi:uncharacterized DUF497 family protein
MRVEFDWDPAKAESNFVKHGVSFEEANRAGKPSWPRLTTQPRPVWRPRIRRLFFP